MIVIKHYLIVHNVPHQISIGVDLMNCTDLSLIKSDYIEILKAGINDIIQARTHIVHSWILLLDAKPFHFVQRWAMLKLQ